MFQKSKRSTRKHLPVRSERVFRSARLDGGELQVEHERLVHHVVARREHEVERALAREGGGLRADRLEAVLVRVRVKVRVRVRVRVKSHFGIERGW